MTVDDLIGTPPVLHTRPDGSPAGYAVSPAVLRYLDRTLSADQATLETGAGVSTVLFAMKRTRHVCVAPSAALMTAIRACLAEANLCAEAISFVEEASERYLPRLEGGPLDLVLIDGRHAFPTPFIDWYYTEQHLKVGGVLIVDDIPIWTGKVLREFLRESREWREVAVLDGRAAVFEKLATGSHSRVWNEQPFVARRSTTTRSQLVAAAGLLIRGKFGALSDMLRRFQANRRRR